MYIGVLRDVRMCTCACIYVYVCCVYVYVLPVLLVSVCSGINVYDPTCVSHYFMCITLLHVYHITTCVPHYYMCITLLRVYQITTCVYV